MNQNEEVETWNIIFSGYKMVPYIGDEKIRPEFGYRRVRRDQPNLSCQVGNWEFTTALHVGSKRGTRGDFGLFSLQNSTTFLIPYLFKIKILTNN